MFSVRIVDADFYVTKPVAGLDVLYSEFRESNVSRVPVLRIFGSTPSAQKTCLHVHRVFPYIFVPYDGTQPSDKYLKQFATSVDFAVQVALGKASSSTRHVHHASIVKRIPFYGYHEEEQDFIKIQFYNPRIIARVVELLQNGAILNKVFQPYEAHIPYILQLIPSTSLSVTAPLIISLIVVLKMSDTERGDTDTQQQHNQQLRNKLWINRFLKGFYVLLLPFRVFSLNVFVSNMSLHSQLHPIILCF